MTATSTLSEGTIKRRVVCAAAKLASCQINERIDKLLDQWSKLHKQGTQHRELEMELKCWADVWIARR